MIKCRYCGAENADDEPRCVKCQRLAASLNSSISRTAALPDQDGPPITYYADKPTLVASTGAPTARRVTQKPLWVPRDEDGSIPLPPADLPRPTGKSRPPQPSQPQQTRPRPPAIVSQASLDFGTPPPKRPLMREIDRSSWFPVASRSHRAAASLLDFGFVVGLCGLFLLSVRVTLGDSPWSLETAPHWAVAFALIAIVYRLAWSLGGTDSPGLRLMGLRLVSFDSFAPSLQQRIFRQLSAWFSLAAAGMGLFWALADQEALTWHDHISQTFLTNAPLPRADASTSQA